MCLVSGYSAYAIFLFQSFFFLQELQKSAMLEESMKKLDTEMQKTDKLLYSMIPKSVADRLRYGDIAVNTCEVCI